MDKEQALHQFWSRFGLTAYDENTVPDDAMTVNNGAYLTYAVVTGDFEHSPFPLYANLWYKSSSWAAITQKKNEIADAIGLGGLLVPFDGGHFWICKGTPFAQRMADDDDTIRRIYLNIMVADHSA